MFTEGVNVWVETGDEKTAACWEKTKVTLLGIRGEGTDADAIRNNLLKEQPRHFFPQKFDT